MTSFEKNLAAALTLQTHRFYDLFPPLGNLSFALSLPKDKFNRAAVAQRFRKRNSYASWMSSDCTRTRSHVW